MKTLTRERRSLAILAAAAMIGCANQAWAQTSSLPPAHSRLRLPEFGEPLELARIAADEQEAVTKPPAWKSLFTDTVRDLKHLPTKDTAMWLTVGAVFAASVHPGYHDVSQQLSGATALRDPARPGAVIGSTPFQVGGATALFAVGKLSGHPRLAHVGGDLLRAQLLAEGLTVGLKQTFRRDRPEGTGFSFPSGHTTVSFASATVLQRHFGWKIGAPAYAVAGYVALSRVQMRRHYLSDVAFGAALGIVAGRTITLGHERGLTVTPQATPGGAAVSFSWFRRTP